MLMSQRLSIERTRSSRPYSRILRGFPPTPIQVGSAETLLSDATGECIRSPQRGLVASWEMPDLRPYDMFVSAILERVAVTVECRGTAQMRVEHLGSPRKKPLLDEIDHPLHRFSS